MPPNSSSLTWRRAVERNASKHDRRRLVRHTPIDVAAQGFFIGRHAADSTSTVPVSPLSSICANTPTTDDVARSEHAALLSSLAQVPDLISIGVTVSGDSIAKMPGAAPGRPGCEQRQHSADLRCQPPVSTTMEGALR